MAIRNDELHDDVRDDQVGTAEVRVDGHPGEQAVAAMLAFGTDTMFTLNGGHIWPLYDGARNQGMRVVDTRHEQTATFAAEAYAKLTRRPGLAALTAGPGITNGVSAIVGANSFNVLRFGSSNSAGSGRPHLKGMPQCRGV